MAESRQQRETGLRQLMATADRHWKTADTQARRGSASGYEHAVRILVELSDGYTLVSSRKAFGDDLRRFLTPHAKRGALLRRLVKAGLWSE